MNIAIIVSFLLALVTSFWAWWPATDQVGTESTAEMDVTGTLLNHLDGEVDPERVAALRVATWDASAKEPAVFEVTYRDGDWVIPSHFSYPADGGSRVGTTAGRVLNVARGPQVTADPDRHPELGVVDPMREGLAHGADRGQRVTVRDRSGKTLVDLIIGDAVEMATRDEPDRDEAPLHYVRIAGEDAVYTAAIEADISTRFRDWVQTDLFQVDADAISRILVKDYSIDESSGAIDQRAQIDLQHREGTASAWVSPEAGADQQVDTETVSALVDEFTDLRLEGVRPYDPAWLRARGFYLNDQGQLFGDEGELVVVLENGLRYHCFFGDIALGDEADVAADVVQAADTTTVEADDGHNRYMAVFVRYSEEEDLVRAALQRRAADAEAVNAAADTESAKVPVPEVPSVPAASKRAAEEQARFGAYFYVIADSSFETLRPDREALFEAIPEEQPEDPAADAADPEEEAESSED